jgi:virginiamycin B lyase
MKARIAVAAALAMLVLGGVSAVSASAHNPSITEYQSGLGLNGGPWDLVDGDDGKLWFTQDTLGVFAPLSVGDGLVAAATGLVAGNPKGISRGPDGNLWIAEAGGNGAIARVTPGGSVTEFTTGLTASDPWDITAGPDGNLWFVSRSPAFVGRITPDGAITEFSAGLTAGSEPTAITAGDDGNLWFTESASPGRIGRVTTAGVITENSIGLTPNMVPTDITAGPDGSLWFTLSGSPGAIGRITPQGEIDEFSKSLTDNSAPTGIATGPDGALWFTESASPGRIGRITTDGEITEYAEGLTADRAPWMITGGPDGNMWFTENANPGALARISLPPLARTRSVEYLSDNSARLPAKIRPNAQATEFYFEYGRGKSFQNRTAVSSAGAGWDQVEVSTRIAGLMPEKKYSYRVVATNDSGVTVGELGSFTTSALEPEAGEVLVGEPSGRVRYKRPGGRWRRLPGWGAELPVGVVLDARRASVKLTSASPRGKTQAARFGGGVMKVRQPDGARGRVDVYLRGGNFAACRRPLATASSRAMAASLATASYVRRERIRRIWGTDSGGRYRTHGRQSQATVRGTRWVTIDRCDGTLTRVTRGAVVVRDFARRRNVLVRAGHSYLARKRTRAARSRH